MLPKRALGLLCWACVLTSCLLLLSATGTFASPQGAGYKVLHYFRVGGDGGWDYLKVDPDAHRIYVSRGTHMMVVDENQRNGDRRSSRHQGNPWHGHRHGLGQGIHQ